MHACISYLCFLLASLLSCFFVLTLLVLLIDYKSVSTTFNFFHIYWFLYNDHLNFMIIYVMKNATTFFHHALHVLKILSNFYGLLEILYLLVHIWAKLLLFMEGCNSLSTWIQRVTHMLIRVGPMALMRDTKLHFMEWQSLNVNKTARRNQRMMGQEMLHNRKRQPREH